MSPRRGLVAAVALGVLLVGAAELSAQCPMCRTALEAEGGLLAAAFRQGILFLLAVPLGLVGVVGALIVRERRRGAEEAPQQDEI